MGGTVCSVLLFQRMKTPKELMQALKDKTEIDLTLRRQLLIVADVAKTKPLGLQLNNETLQVTKITVGCIRDFNNKTTLNLSVLEGDVMFSVNGKIVSGTDWKEQVSNVADG